MPIDKDNIIMISPGYETSILSVYDKSGTEIWTDKKAKVKVTLGLEQSAFKNIHYKNMYYKKRERKCRYCFTINVDTNICKCGKKL